MEWMLALTVFATFLCTDVELMPEKTRQRDRVATETEPVNGNDRPCDCRQFTPLWGRVYYFRIQLVTLTS